MHYQAKILLWLFIRYQFISLVISLTFWMTWLQSIVFSRNVLNIKTPEVSPAWYITCTGEAFEYPPMVMGTENCSINTGSVPNFPGKMKSKSDHSSRRLFCIGEPDRMMRWGVRNCLGKARTFLLNTPFSRWSPTLPQNTPMQSYYLTQLHILLVSSKTQTFYETLILLLHID